MKKVAVLVSGGGTNLQALIDAQEQGKLKNGEICCVIASKPGVYALERADRAGIPYDVVARKHYASAEEFDHALCEKLGGYQPDLIVLAGFLCILGKEILSQYANRIINIHPSLIPAFCGDGFYGLKVHEAVLASGVKMTGATVHFVNEVTDGGAIIAQKAVAVQEGDTPEVLQQRVMREAEWKLLPYAVSLFCEGAIQVKDGKTVIDQSKRQEESE